MNRALALTAVISLLLSGCAMSSAQDTRAIYTGEVWTWDEQENTVTLRQGVQTVRVKVTPDELRRLRLHEYAAVRGELAPPMSIVNVVVPTGPMTALPAGPLERTEFTGSVVAVEPNGLLSVDSARGRHVLLTASGAAARFTPGMPVRVHVSLEPVEMVPASDPRVQTAPRVSDAPDPAALADGRQGDWAVVTGRVLGVNPAGALMVESPAGPIVVVAPDASRFRPGSTVRVRTFVQVGA